MPVSRRRALLGTAGVATSALAGCLGRTAGSTDVPIPVVGDPEAGVTVASFEDFACPHCRNYHLNVFPDIRSQYIDSGTIRYEHHDFPLPVTSASRPAANAARAVQNLADDNAFFEYTKSLFENQRSLGPDTYASLANDLGLDGGAVREAATSGEYSNITDADRQNGRERGVRGTPTVFVDGSKLDSFSYAAISAEIESALSG